MKQVVLGVGGGIAAYKACDLVSKLREREITARVAMTRAATRFVRPLTFAALTEHPVLVDDTEEADPTIPHVRWARWADGVVLAPATADLLGRVAHGLANDGLTSLLLALDAGKPVVVAPAMNTQMWENPLVRANLETLKAVDGGRRFRFVEPVDKRLACGEIGVGGLAEPEAIAAAVAEALG
ncbi:MAG: flavoprotein [Planctomycetota bacterium JB042]